MKSHSMVLFIGGTTLAACGAAVIGLLGIVGGPPAQPDGEKFTVDATPIARLVDTPCTHALFVERLGAGDLIDSPQLRLASRLTLRRLADLPFVDLSEMKLKGVQAELAGLDPHAPDCRRTGSNP
ncbi:MAG: hypothetical protein IT293_10750 [Deltaproteobacteria bacterium]|nr:hypothetical protein [Deltaproteobacteria bacterium]